MNFQALNEFVQFEPLEKDKKGGILVAETKETQTAKGKVLSVGPGRVLPDGTEIRPQVEIGDIIVLNPRLVDEIDLDREKIFIINSIGIYGKCK